VVPALVSGLLLLTAWCGIGGLIGVALGAPKGRPLTGLFLGTFLNLFGWLMLLGAPVREGHAAPALSSFE
jgi:hypothetical protein